MAERIARIVCMGTVGGFSALLDGAMLDVDGVMLWPTAAALMTDARRLGIATSSLVIDTRSVIVGLPGVAFRQAA